MTRTRRGFTLIELLIVITVIAILASLILSAYGPLHRTVLELHCKNNLNQLAKCIITYCARNDGYFPLLHDEGRWAGANSWLYIGGTTRNTNDFDITEGALVSGGYVGDPEIFFCPLDDRTRAPSVAIDPPISSYAMNGSANKYSTRGVRRIDDFSPRDFMLIEENEEFSNFWDANIWPRPNGDWDSMTARHRGGGHVACMDAHVIWMDWNDMRDEMYLERNGDPDNRWNPD